VQCNRKTTNLDRFSEAGATEYVLEVIFKPEGKIDRYTVRLLISENENEVIEGFHSLNAELQKSQKLND
jgi:hypothetical protein